MALTRASAATKLPDGFRVLCSLCGQALDAKTGFSSGQLKKKRPRCRACAPNKFGNQAAGGHQSKRENNRVIGYRALATAGLIRDFAEQVRFELIPAQLDPKTGKTLELACYYYADVVYTDPDGIRHVVDVKGFRTDVYRLKRKLMLLVHGIRIEEE